MTEEIKKEEIKQECFCQKRGKDIVTIAIGSFVGVYCALSLFAAIHRPPCPMMQPFGIHPMMHHQMYHQHNFPPVEKFKPGKFKVKTEQQKPVENEQ